MLWQIEIRPKGSDTELARVREEYNLLTHTQEGTQLITAAGRGYLVEGDLSRPQAEQLLGELLLDPLVEAGRLVFRPKYAKLTNVLLEPCKLTELRDYLLPQLPSGTGRVRDTEPFVENVGV